MVRFAIAEVATALACLAVGGAGALPSENRDACVVTAQWTGWENIKHAFVFGDSYTQTGFNYTLSPPSPEKPFGNPDYPGWTSSNGPNWVGFLTFKYNASRLQTYNLAYGGATVDSALVQPYIPTVLSVRQQVEDEFTPAYTGASPRAPSAPRWTGADSLFAFWIGINDVGNTYGSGPDAWPSLYSRIFSVYAGLVAKLYDAGARNFVFLNVPPVDRSPLTVGQGQRAAEQERAAIADWNGRVADLAAALKSNHTEQVNVWLYDTNESFGRVIDNPTAFPQTAGLKNTTAYCTAYQNGTPTQDTLTPSCGVAVNEYFWLNNLHPTYPIHELVAKEVVDKLEAGPGVC
ncbi:carbohydrate esterase family 16 protein [Durotheca rogersii]|uniref:carbohydrate esterase family 16 protein n=1 Tax=Durotheca rogersii TaxID=419775 RepID=UPI00222038FC|nr:carbohydrate esterase family 16 protein [Durotheca rogersii]KAI5861427.1 carbohydrate esterase family 16 protein [Durotheca rogersii]